MAAAARLGGRGETLLGTHRADILEAMVAVLFVGIQIFEGHSIISFTFVYKLHRLLTRKTVGVSAHVEGLWGICRASRQGRWRGIHL